MISFFAATFLNTWLNGITFSRISTTRWLRQDTLFSLPRIFFHFIKSPMISGVPLLIPSDILHKSMGSRLKQKRRSVPGWDVLEHFSPARAFYPAHAPLLRVLSIERVR